MKSENRKLAAIMFTDIVSFSNMMSIDEDLAISTLDSKVDILKSTLKDFDGKLVKLIGDGTLSSFDSVVDTMVWSKYLHNSNRSSKYPNRGFLATPAKALPGNRLDRIRTAIEQTIFIYQR